jgi:hypothetical protein
MKITLLISIIAFRFLAVALVFFLVTLIVNGLSFTWLNAFYVWTIFVAVLCLIPSKGEN